MGRIAGLAFLVAIAACGVSDDSGTAPPRTAVPTTTATTAAPPTSEATPPGPMEDWPQFRRDISNTGHSVETGITSANVDRLQRRWEFNTGEKVSASATVATVDGERRLFVGNWDGRFWAIDAETGAARWSFDIDRTGEVRCAATGQCRIASSAAVVDGTVYFGAENAIVYALDASNGDLAWSRPLGDTDDGDEIWASPAVHAGVVYIGVSGHNDSSCVVGRVVALDADTGDVLWATETIDQDSCPRGVCIGGGVWSSPALDTDSGLLYVGTGNSGRGCSPPTENATRYPDGLLVLEMATGAVVDFYQTYPDDLTDTGDVGAAPVLYDTEFTNECTGESGISRWVAVPSKDSALWVWKRSDTGLASEPMLLRFDSGVAVTSPGLVITESETPCEGGTGVMVEQVAHLIVPTGGGSLFAVRHDATGLSIEWDLRRDSCAADGSCPLFSPPAIVSDVIFFGGGEGNVYAAGLDGEFRWSNGTLGLVAGGPAVSHGTVYYTSFDGSVYAESVDGG